MSSNIRKTVLLAAIVAAGIGVAADPTAILASTPGNLWTPPVDIESRNLLYGRGGVEHLPRSTDFTFVEEDKDGTSPKFDVVDADGVKWKVKLGYEAKPEVAASRLVWAMGYHVREEYHMPWIRVANLPAKLHRGNKYVEPGGMVWNARLTRVLKNEKKVSTWKWRESPFRGTREFNGLRVLMAVINNWDLKDDNNAIYENSRGDRFYAISDLGGTFGAPGVTFSHAKMKGNLKEYSKSKFIVSTDGSFVNFSAPAFPQINGVAHPRNFVSRIHMQWIRKDIPRDDAVWMGQLLGRLSPEQIRDVFRSAHYSPEEVEGFALIVEERIALLNEL